MDELEIRITESRLECISRSSSMVLFTVSFGADFSNTEVIELFLRILKSELIKIYERGEK